MDRTGGNYPVTMLTPLKSLPKARMKTNRLLDILFCFSVRSANYNLTTLRQPTDLKFSGIIYCSKVNGMNAHAIFYTLKSGSLKGCSER